MKECPSCKELKPLNEYYTNGWYISTTGIRKRKYKPTCKTCERKAGSKVAIEFIRQFYGGYKCQKCGFEGHPSQFDCHHRNPEEKEFKISGAWAKATNSPKALTEELKKCDLLCSNCHRLVHFNYELK